MLRHPIKRNGVVKKDKYSSDHEGHESLRIENANQYTCKRYVQQNKWAETDINVWKEEEKNRLNKMEFTPGKAKQKPARNEENEAKVWTIRLKWYSMMNQ